MTQNKAPAEDLRVRRTRKMLQQALMELTVEKGFTAVTVQDIAERAMVNRATFYRHYQDKYDLLERYMEQVYDLTASQEAAPARKAGDRAQQTPQVGLLRLLEHLQQHADFYRVMLGKKGDPAFAQRIQQYIEKRFRDLVPRDAMPGMAAPSNPPRMPLELCLSYLSHAGVGAIVWWLRDGRSYAPAEIALWLSRLSKADLETALGPSR